MATVFDNIRLHTGLHFPHADSDTNSDSNHSETKVAPQPRAPPTLAELQAQPQVSSVSKLSSAMVQGSLGFQAPVHRHKLKGEAAPHLLAPQKSPCPIKTQKILDEAHHFGLGEHYSKIMDDAKAHGFRGIKWPTNFTLFHLAAKKNNKQFISWLVQNDFDDIHTIDDFGKKPIDYACPRKRESVHPVLQALMNKVPAPKNAAETKYQQIKAGTWVDPTKCAKKEKVDMKNIMECADIADGDMPALRRHNCPVTVYEAECIVPAEYKKCFKKLETAGWANMKGTWPHQQSLLHWAARNGKEELCWFLVAEYKADPHEEDGNGHDAIYHAKVKRHRKLMKNLVARFKDADKDKKMLRKKREVGERPEVTVAPVLRRRKLSEDSD